MHVLDSKCANYINSNTIATVRSEIEFPSLHSPVQIMYCESGIFKGEVSPFNLLVLIEVCMVALQS